MSGVFPRWIACAFCDAQLHIPHLGDHTCCCGMRTHVSGPRDMLAAAERLAAMGIESPESVLPLRQAAEREEASVSNNDYIATLKIRRVTREVTEGTEHKIVAYVEVPGREREYTSVMRIENGDVFWSPSQREYEEQALWRKFGETLGKRYCGGPFE